jgi:hypothetical protein
MTTEDKKHLGNVKLSSTRKSINIHIFQANKFYTLPLNEVSEKAGKIFQFISGQPEVIGEISPMKKGEQFRTLKIKTDFYYLKKDYLAMLTNGSNLTLAIYEE